MKSARAESQVLGWTQLSASGITREFERIGCERLTQKGEENFLIG
jgi:hypothetical protein